MTQAPPFIGPHSQSSDAPRVTYQGAVYPVRPNETALDALVRGGAPVSFSCRKGSCHTCLMRVSEGVAPEHAQRGLRSELVQSGHILPCLTHPTAPLTLVAPDRSTLFVPAMVMEKVQCSPKVVRLRLEPETTMQWEPGQYVNLRAPNGLVRSYSIASSPQQGSALELHVGLVPGGALSQWLHRELRAGEMVELQGPMGNCVYRPELSTRNLLLLATGTGIAPILGVVGQAIERHHQAGIEVIHAVSAPEEAYLRLTFETLTQTHSNVRFTQLVGHHDAVSACFDGRPDLAGTVLYVCGSPDMVYAARVRAIASGIHRREIYADPFEDTVPYWPRDREKLEAWPKDPELWRALDGGPRLRSVLTEFYDLVYEDARLAPFFHNVTKDRAIAKQYEFLAGVFTGEIPFFGLKPFNAHHWMIISDDLFDYREDLFESVLRRSGLAEPLVRRWLSFHELFRRELVKNSQRGLILDGVEQLREGFSDERLEMGMVCDGCGGEMPAGSRGRLHRRTGQLYCGTCTARRLSETPPALA